MEERAVKKSHTISITDRNKLLFSGITDVGAFNDDSIILYSDFGEIILKGENFHVNCVNTESGEVRAEGRITSLTYTDRSSKKLGFLGKVFK